MIAEHESEPDRRPSLSDQAGGALRRLVTRVPWPSSYAPALLTLAAVPGCTALLAGMLALGEAHRNGVLRQAAAARLVAMDTIRDHRATRAAMAPLYATPTLTAALAEVTALLPPDATLHAITRGPDGTLRIEVDCPDPDALIRAFRLSQSGTWRSIAQSTAVGTGIRVTLEAAAR